MESFQQILLKIGIRPPGHILRPLSRWRFVQIDDLVDQSCKFRSQMGKNGNFLTLTANISNWVARGAKLQQTSFVRHFVGRLLRRKCCFYDKNWATNGNFSGANEKIELMSPPISPILFPIDLHRVQPLAKLGPNNSIWQEIRCLFFACKLKKFFVYWHRSVIPVPNFFFWIFLPWKFQVLLDRTVCRRTRVPQVACCFWEVAFFFYFFCCLSWNVSCSIHLKFSKRSKFWKKLDVDFKTHI